ncbi:MAG: YggT family protein [Gammaproteobacteria bacterium]|nr:YggT family protein [Gammaproteobacteria bacterium]
MVGNAFVFLTTTLFNIYLFILAIRVLLAYAHMHYFNPVVQFITRVTQPIIAPLRKVIPNFRGIELSTLLVMVLLECLKIFIVFYLVGMSPSIVTMFIFAFSATLKVFLQTWFYAILIQAILSWIQTQSPMNDILYAITAPILRPFQRIIPPISGFDISPIPALILLQFVAMMLPG